MTYSFAGIGPAAVCNMLVRVWAKSQNVDNNETANVLFDDLLMEAFESIPKKNLGTAHLSKLS